MSKFLNILHAFNLSFRCHYRVLDYRHKLVMSNYIFPNQSLGEKVSYLQLNIYTLTTIISIKVYNIFISTMCFVVHKHCLIWTSLLTVIGYP